MGEGREGGGRVCPRPKAPRFADHTPPRPPPLLLTPSSLPSGIFHLIQIKKVRKQDFQKEAQNFRLLTGTHEGGTPG